MCEQQAIIRVTHNKMIKILGSDDSMKQRRVGTLTLGIVLVMYGVLFLIHTFCSSLKYYYIFKFWPVILLILGCEILYCTLRYRDEKFIYDFAAIIMIAMVMVFAMGMAAADWIYKMDIPYITIHH